MIFPWSDCSESLKDSIARALRHSRKAGQETYDKRTSDERKESAIEFAKSQAENAVVEEAHTAGSSDDDELPKPGDFVAVVEQGSTSLCPKILVGQVLHYEGRDAHLLFYQAVPSKKYVFKMCLDGQAWTEDKCSLEPVTMRATSVQGEWRLCTTPRQIHKKICKQAR